MLRLSTPFDDCVYWLNCWFPLILMFVWGLFCLGGAMICNFKNLPNRQIKPRKVTAYQQKDIQPKVGPNLAL